jgi:hypothetical protein
MYVVVEPLDGSELERLITALVNATGLVHRIVNDAADQHPNADGTEVIGVAAERLRRVLAPMEEHNTDEELEVVTRLLMETTLLVSEELGLEDLFRV